ncbi:hypothetical protein PBRA_007040 [Plasmodiophora brassicae]|nr:hypothetical protein PBRA_007040 [Plasmodiophora brassicae]
MVRLPPVADSTLASLCRFVSYPHTLVLSSTHWRHIAAGVLTAMLVAMVTRVDESSPGPYAHLATFVDRHRDVSGGGGAAVIDAWLLGRLNTYAGAACVEGQTVDAVRAALRRQLQSAPMEVVAMDAILPETSVHSSVQGKSSGPAYSFMAFWSTKSMSRGVPAYSTCALVSTVEVSVAEHVAGYEEQTSTRIVGYEPCRCNWLGRCQKCPVRERFATKLPIAQPYPLTQRDHVALRKLVVQAAVDRAAQLLATIASPLPNPGEDPDSGA